MSRKYNTNHQTRGRSHYGPKARSADRYGVFRNGVRETADKLNVQRPEDQQQEDS